MILSKIFKFESGYTLIELVLVILLLGILSGYLYSEFGGMEDSESAERTLAQMEAIKRAIFGSETITDHNGIRNNFGFLGDVGRIPSNLGELTTQGALPSWSFNTQYGIGGGWRESYLSQTDATAPSSYDDGWGNAFSYSITSDPPNLTSYGSDNAAGGSGFSTDFVMNFPLAMRLSTVKGILTDVNTPQSGATVDLVYPVDGVLTSHTTTTDANGYYSFSAVPFGVQSIGVTSAPTLQPNQIAITQSDVTVPDTTLGYFEGSEAVTYVSGSASLYDGNQRVIISLKSTYNTSIQLDALTFTSTAGGDSAYVSMNGTDETFSSAVNSGDQADITATLTIPPHSDINTFEILTNKSQNGKDLTYEFTWENRTKTDTVQVSP